MDADQIVSSDAFNQFLRRQSYAIFTTYVDSKMETARLTANEDEYVDKDDYGFKDRVSISVIVITTTFRVSADIPGPRKCTRTS